MSKLQIILVFKQLFTFENVILFSIEIQNNCFFYGIFWSLKNMTKMLLNFFLTLMLCQNKLQCLLLASKITTLQKVKHITDRLLGQPHLNIRVG
jgi:hypothetical protein